MFCTNCGNEVAENAVVCVKCGVPPRKSKKFCYNCGTAIEESQVVCVKCGVNLNSKGGHQGGGKTAAEGGKSRTVAAILALVLGFLGIHKFYYRSWGWGAVYLGAAFLTCFFSLILTLPLGIIEAIMLFTMSDEKFDERYNETPASPFKW